MSATLSSFNFAAAEAKQPHKSSPQKQNTKGESPIKQACRFLNVITHKRSPQSIAAEIWEKLQTPDMLIVWMLNVKMHRFAVMAAKHYENRANQ